MRRYSLRFFNILLGLLLGVKAFSQVVVTSSDSLNCGTTCTTLTAHVTGDSPTNAGVTSDDIYSVAHNIGFTFNFYGVNYTQCVLGANGTISFNLSDAGAYDPWTISAPLLGNTSKLNNICGPWVDIDIFSTGSPVGTETYSTSGIAPYRRFAVTYCGCSMFSCTAQRTTSQIIIYETTNVIEVHTAKKPICTSWNPSSPPGAGGRAIVGVQNAAGTAATTAPGRDYPSIWAVPPTEAWRFTPTGGGSAYTVASIPYAPIPLASSAVYWYNAATGAYLGTGTTLSVCPTVTTTYKAGALGCGADTSWGYYTVTASSTGPVVILDHTDPTLCGTCDGTITLKGLSPGLSDTITYTKGGVAQPPIVAIVNAGGQIILTGLCPDTYDNFVVKQLSCYSLPVGPVTLVYPPISTTVTTSNPTICGACDGSIVLSGLYPNHAYTVTYNKGGMPQPPISTTSSATGTITINGLCAGTYSNIVAAFGTCVTPAMGPYTLVNPPISISSVTTTDPSLCGVCDGSLVLNGLYPNHAFTVNYNFNGVPQPSISTTSSATGTITITGLCAGVYDNIVASYGDCITPAVGPYTLTNPPISISSVDPTNPSFCGICDGQLVLNGLYPNHAFTVNYYFNGVPQPAVGTTSSATGTITLTGLCAGTYSNIIASFGVCATPAAGPVTLSNPPTPPLTIASFTNPTQCGYCNGEIVIRSLTPFSLDTVRFFKDGAAQAPYITVTQSDSTVHLANMCAGNYTGFTVSIGACVYDVTGTANLTTVPVVGAFSYTIKQGCPKDTVSFNNASTTAPGAGLFYVWNFGDGTSDTTMNPVHIFAQGTYTVTMLATNHYCDSTAQVVLVLEHPLDAQFIDTPNVICQGKTVTFTNTTITSDPGTTYMWNFSEPPGDNAKDGTHTFNNMGVYTVTLVATDGIPCRDTVKHMVYVDTSGGVELNATDTVICEGSFMTFEGKYSSVGNIGVTWNFGDGDNKNNTNPVEHAYHAPGIYTVTVTALYRACDDLTTTRNVIVYPQPQVNLGPDTSICPGSNPLVLDAAKSVSDPNIGYLWNTGETTSKITVTQPGYYYVKSKVSGCSSSDTIWVANDCYMSMPNVFTPNGDGVNEYFFPRQLLTRGLTAFHMEIFNRWGQLIFETNTLDGRGWDGKFNDVAQPEGVYIYIIDATFKDGQKEHHQGNVTLLR